MQRIGRIFKFQVKRRHIIGPAADVPMLFQIEQALPIEKFVFLEWGMLDFCPGLFVSMGAHQPAGQLSGSIWNSRIQRPNLADRLDPPCCISLAALD